MKSVQVILSKLGMRLFDLIKAWILRNYVWFCCLDAAVCYSNCVRYIGVYEFAHEFLFIHSAKCFANSSASDCACWWLLLVEACLLCNAMSVEWCLYKHVV